jgi:hypothetical protein
MNISHPTITTIHGTLISVEIRPHHEDACQCATTEDAVRCGRVTHSVYAMAPYFGSLFMGTFGECTAFVAERQSAAATQHIADAMITAGCAR